jgi:hypothetical protein
MSSRFAALEKLYDDDDDVNVTRAWESIKIRKLHPHIV